MKVVVVESPAKAKTINKYLGKDFKVLASYGHVRDLPAKDGSVRPDEDFAMTWEAESRGAARIREIAEAVKGAETLILATDPDREGEAISWHLHEALRGKKVLKDVTVERVTFNAITKAAVTAAMARPRAIDEDLVGAYLARRALDYLVGFTLSPVLWRKLPGSRSAGRVQSVALRLVVEREMEIERFRAQEYWTVEAVCDAGQTFDAKLASLAGKTLKKFDLATQDQAEAAARTVRDASFTVSAVEAKPLKRNPPPPFTTSTLQQEAARKLGFSAKRTMQVAQKLYEGVDIGGETVGLITYMRTDGVQMAEEALVACRKAIGLSYGDRYVPETPRRYSSKAKNAQEAHEAIRPTDPMRRPDSLRLESDMARLYELVWKRAIASQMAGAVLERTTIDMQDSAGAAGLRAVGTVVLFDGFLTLYDEGRDDPDGDEEGGRLPQLKVGQAVRVREVTPNQHFTEPPPRYSEASLVKKMEELGIGRPSTYASILSVLQERAYVRLEKNRFHPEDKGRLVTAFLENFFARYVEYDFTAGLEEKLDDVSAGALDWKALLREFWTPFHADVEKMGELRVSNVIAAIDEALSPHLFPEKADGGDPRVCPSCSTGRLSLKTGKFGAFIGCSNYPDCRYTRPLAAPDAEGDAAAPSLDGKVLGVDDRTGEEITLRSGRFGPYVQRGEGETLKRASLPKGWTPEAMDLEKALRLLSLPREVGAHPEDGAMILANIGRYGPYIQHAKTYANLPGVDDVFEIGLNRAVTLIAEKRAGGGRPQRGAPAALRELGAHPVSGAAIKVFSGRYGPYVADGTTNATLPKGADPAAVTLEEAVQLIDARTAAAPAKGKKPARKAAAPKAKAKAGAKAKPAAKKAAPKAPKS